jgi:hypothetical protein
MLMAATKLNKHTLLYHLSKLVRSNAVNKQGYKWIANGAYRTVEQVREAVDEHIKTSATVTRIGGDWTPGSSPIAPISVTTSYFQRHCLSIRERMYQTGFVQADVEAFDELLERAFGKEKAP